MFINVVMIAVGVLALGILAAGIFTAVREGQPSVVEERLGRYADAGQSLGLEGDALPRERSSPLGDRLNQVLQGRSFAGRISTDLARADMKFTVGEYLALMVICAAGGVLIAILFTALPECVSSPIGLLGCLATRNYADTLVATVLAGLGGLLAPRLYVGWRIGQRVSRFTNQLGDTINLLVNSLRSGYSILQAMEAAGREQPPPVGPEFKRVVQEMQLGVAMEQGLDNLLRRIPSEDLDLMITAIKVQREVGGNLAEILDVISYTIRERIRIKGEIRVLTAQGMATGYALVALPVILAIILFFINRPYIMQLFVPENQPCGWAMIGVGIVMIIAGWLVVRKIVQIEV
jgi:tight adherence protein B